MVSNRIISFKDNNCIEYLDQHVGRMMEYYEKIFLENNWNEVTAHRLGVREEVVDLANRVAIVYHDVGKAFFQDTIVKGKGASYHEYFSVLILHKTFPLIVEHYGSLVNELFNAVAWSIIVHHLSLRRSIRNPLHVIIKPSIMPGSIRSRNLREDHAKALSAIIKSWLGVDVFVEPGVYQLDDLRKTPIAYSLDKFFKQYYSLALRITRVLIVTDTLAAQDLRCSRDYRVYVADIPRPKVLLDARRLVKEWLQG